MSAGYSGTPLIKKLGIKPGFRIALINAPAEYLTTLGELPAEVMIVYDMDAAAPNSLDLIQFFVTERQVFEHEYHALKDALKQNGSLWISWYKKSAKIPTDITEDVIRDFALANGMVDVKVAAVDALWSGLKLMYRVKDRT